MNTLYNSNLSNLYEDLSQKLINKLNLIQKETFIVTDANSHTLDFLSHFLNHSDKITTWELIKFAQSHDSSKKENYELLKHRFYNYLIAKGKITDKQIIKYENNIIKYNVEVKRPHIILISPTIKGELADLKSNNQALSKNVDEYIKSDSSLITLSPYQLINNELILLIISESRRKILETLKNNAQFNPRWPVTITSKTTKVLIATNLK